MLSFLAMAAKKRFVVDRYSWISGKESERKARHHPRHFTTSSCIRRDGSLTREQIDALHEQAHSECFSAKSVTIDVTVEAGYRNWLFLMNQ